VEADNVEVRELRPPELTPALRAALRD